MTPTLIYLSRCGVIEIDWASADDEAKSIRGLGRNGKT
jgi:hypothetical protein